MGRNAIIFHGTGGSPDNCWYPWLAGRLAARGYAVEVPHHPGINVEPITMFLPKVLGSQTFDEDTVLVGHSGGPALLLALLQHLEVTHAQAILVGGCSTPPNHGDGPVPQ
ncbi:alpha/beta hydrolase, partial [Micromonospora fiedleri]|nr:alpha/beta hydrolase [Micromonospora fiedleri]